MEGNTRQNNPILTAQFISKLVEKIKKQQNNTAELKYLKDKCISSEDPFISLTASRALVALVECDVIQISSTLAELVSSLSFAKSFIGVTTTICDLLQLDLKCKIGTVEKYKCPYNLRDPQHPLISILRSQNKDAWIDILSKISDFYCNDKTAFYANEFLFPFYMYVICDPNNENSELFQYKLWNFLIRIKSKQSVDMRLYIIAWLQMSKKQHILKASNFLIDMMQLSDTSSQHKNINDVFILWLTSFIYELIKHDCDPRHVITCLHELILSYKELDHLCSPMLIMLANCIISCPSVYLYNLLALCKTITFLNTSNVLAIQALRVSLLQWVAYGCSLTSNSLQLANQVLLHLENNNKYVNNQTERLHSNRIYDFLKSSNKHVHLAVELSILSESLTSKNILQWLIEIETLPEHALKNQYNYLAALLLYEYNPEITLQIIKTLLKITNSCNELTSHFLILILYKLSNSISPEIHFALLKTLPKMGVLKENLPLILNTLEAMKKAMFNLKSFPITLYFDLWNINIKCYPYLQNVLISTCEKTESLNQWWEFHVTKAHVLKQICVKKPEVHGTELVAHLSEILYKCSDQNGELPSALAIDGIKALCNAGIIDFTSTWNELSQRCNLENRVTVIKSLCNFMSEAAYFELAECSTKLLEEIITKLWYYATSHENIEVISAAFKALECFTLEQVSPYLPDKFKGSERECSTFGLVHGDCWINLLVCKQDTAADIVGDFLIKHVTIEIAEYRSGTYTVKRHKEPQDFNYLPEYSIVRALGNYIRVQVQKWEHSAHKCAYLQCLRVLSQPYSKPLPPMDWCFLQELVHVLEARSYCITLASHQVQLSGTARRLIENYVAALTHMSNNDEDMRTIFKNLKYLCNSIQPVTLRPFIENSIKCSLQNIENEKNLFNDLIDYLKEVLSDEHLLESNRLVLSETIVQTARKLNTEQYAFKKLLDCIVVLPIRFIDELSSPRLWKDESPENIKLSVKVRCALALKATISSLTWLNDFIDAACFMPIEHDYVLKNIAEVLKSYRHSDIACSWIIELLGHIQSIIANENTSHYQIRFLCDVYTLSMIVLAGQDIFVLSQNDLIVVPEYRLRLFPYSVALLLENKNWRSCYPQISEWLYHMANYHETPENYKIVFYQTLMALRHEKGFANLSKWMKYVGYNLNFDI